MAKAKVAIAKKKVSDDINIRYAKASAAVATADYRVNKEANTISRGGDRHECCARKG